VSERRSIFWEVTESVILSKKKKKSVYIYIYIYTCVLFRTVSGMKLFHCTVPKLLIRKIYYLLFLIPVFIATSDKVGAVYIV
jgi:hypothetical protein